MRKLLSPILYPLFLIPTLIITIMFVSFSERVYDFIFPGTGEIEAIIGILVIGGFLFLLANVLMRKLEKLEKPTVADHFRQSSLWYVGLVLGLILAIQIYSTQRGALAFAELIIALVTAGLAIIVNALYLYAVTHGITKRIYQSTAKYRTTIIITILAVIVALALFAFLRYTYWNNEQEMMRPVWQNKIQQLPAP